MTSANTTNAQGWFAKAGPLTKSVIRAILPRGKYTVRRGGVTPPTIVEVYCAYCGRLVHVDARYKTSNLAQEYVCPSGLHVYPLGESAATYVRFTEGV